MAVGTTTAILGATMIAGGAMSAYSQVKGASMQAKAIQQQADYNAQIYEQQGQMILEKKKVQDYQFNREAARVRGAIVAKTAGKGFQMSGSPLAILIDNETQMQFDKAVEDYNLDVERNFASSAATATRQTGVNQARLAKYTGYSNAFSTMLNTGTNLGMMNMRAGKL